MFALLNYLSISSVTQRRTQYQTIKFLILQIPPDPLYKNSEFYMSFQKVNYFPLF